MPALELNLPGVSVEPMTRMSPAAGQMLTEAYQVFERAVISR
jgi:hypothetical protein